MQRPGDRLVEVELVEDDDAPGPDGGRPRGDGDSRRTDRRPARSLRSTLARVPHEVVLTAVAALALGGAGVAVAEVGADRARTARLAEVPGLTASLAAPLREDWRTPGGHVVAVLDDLVVHWDADSRGVVGTELRDGSPRYTAPGDCRVARPEGDGSAWFTGGSGSATQVRPGDVLLCVEGAGHGALGAGGATARVVEPATGDVEHTIAMDAGDTWQVVDGDLVSIGLDADGLVAAGRWSLRSGERRWAYHGTQPVAVDPSAGWGTSMGNGTMGLEAGDFSVVLDLDTGAETDSLAGPDDTATVDRVELADGRVLEYGAVPSGGVRTTVHPADGGEPATVPGIVPPLAIDDGSVPGAVVAIDVESTGPWGMGMVELDSGEWRWKGDEVGGAGVAVVSGVVLVTDGSRTTALDARTGELRWRSEPGSTNTFTGWEIVTDGRRVLVLDGVGAERELVARDVRTGERVWGTEPPLADGSLVPLPDGTVLMHSGGQVVALRP